MGVQLPVATDNPVVRIIGRILGWKRFETRPLLHASEDEVEAVPVLTFHALQVGLHVLLFAYPFLGLFHRDLVVAGIGIDPGTVGVGALLQHLRGDGVLATHVAKEEHDVPFPRQQRQVSLDDNPIEAVIYKNQ